MNNARISVSGVATGPWDCLPAQNSEEEIAGAVAARVEDAEDGLRPEELKLQNLRIVLRFGATGAAAQKDPRRSRVFIVQDLPEVSTRRWRRCQGPITPAQLTRMSRTCAFADAHEHFLHNGLRSMGRGRASSNRACDARAGVYALPSSVMRRQVQPGNCRVFFVRYGHAKWLCCIQYALACIMVCVVQKVSDFCGNVLPPGTLFQGATGTAQRSASQCITDRVREQNKTRRHDTGVQMAVCTD